MSPPLPDAFELFVVHAAADRTFVEGYLLPALGLPEGKVRFVAQLSQGPESVDQLARELAVSRVILVVLTPAFLTDPWAQRTEDWATHTALGAERTVIPLLLSPCHVPLHLRANVKLSFCDAEEWEEGVARLRKHFNAPLPLEPVLPCPYPGMRPFAAADAAHFHGRDHELAALLSHLDDGTRELLVLGPSGSGKSSLVYAGLLPAIERRACAARPLVRALRPGDAPIARLAAALGVDENAPRDALTAAQLTAAVDALLPLAAPAAPSTTPAAPPSLLLFVDQLEELFALAEVRAQARFAEAVAALRADPRVTLVFTLRADFFAELMQSPLWTERGIPHVGVAPLRGEALRSAIEKPARTAGVFLEPALVERLLADAEDAACPLPLMQETLVQLWERRRRRLLPLAEYAALGDTEHSGLAIAISRRADRCLAELSAERQLLARRTFLRLVSFGEGRSDTRRQQPVSALGGAEPAAELHAVLAALAAARLIVMDAPKQVPAAETTAATDDRVDLAHEALITAWPPFAGWIKHRSADEALRRRLELLADEWVRHGRGTAGLLDEEELPLALAFRSTAAAELGESPELSLLIAATQRHQLELRRRSRRRVAMIAGSLSAFTILAVILAFVARDKANAADEQIKVASMLREENKSNIREKERQRGEATTQRNKAERAQGEVERLLGVSYQETGRQLLLQGQGQRALPYFVAARQQGLDSQGLRALFHTAAANPLVATLSHAGDIRAYELSRDGELLFTSSEDHTVKIWQLPSGELRHTLTHDAAVSDFTLTDDESLLVSVTSKGAVWTWELASGNRRGEPRQLGNPDVYEPRLSPGGHRVAVAMPFAHTAPGFSAQGAYLWNLDAPSQPPLRLHPEDMISSLGFSPDGNLLLTLGSTGVLKIWSAESGELRFETQTGVALFTHDSRQLVLGDHTGQARLWDLDTGEPAIGAAFEHPELAGFAADPKGFLLATFGRDRVARVWNNRGHPVCPLLPHGAPIRFAGFSSDGDRLITGSEDHTARIWDAATGLPLTDRLEHGAEVTLAGFADAAHLAFTIGDDHKIRLWDAQPRARELTAEHASFIAGEMIASPARSHLVTLRGTGHLWDMRSGAHLAELPPSAPRSSIHRVVFSADGQRLLTAEQSGLLLIRKADTGAPLAAPIDALTDSGASSAQRRDHGRAIRALALDRQGARAAAAFDSRFARVWETATGKPLTPPLEHTDSNYLNTLALSPGGATLLTLGNEGAVRLWSVASGKSEVPPLVHPRAVTSAAFLDDAQLYTTCDDGVLRIWSVATGERLRSFVHGTSINAARVSDDGKLLATAGSDNAARLWSLETGEQLLAPLPHPDDVHDLAFSADGARLVSLAGGGMRIWEVSSGALLFEVPVDRASFTSASFAVDGALFARDNDARVWRWDVAVDAGTLEDWQAIEQKGRFALERGMLVERED